MDNKRKFLVQLIEKLKNQVSDREIAIIGVTGRYPQANTLDDFWDNLKKGQNCISEIPPDRWNWKEYYDENATQAQIGQSNSKWGGFIADVDKFDPLFFNISPREAQFMDPQERLFLETVWALFEDAGYTRQTLTKLNHQVGTFVGVMNNNYEWLGAEATAKGHFTPARSAYWSIANRVSYYFDLTGPSLAIDTACSSSFTAIHLACDSLRKGECQIAIAGGVNLILHPMHYYRLCFMNMLASDDQCKSFGDGADGLIDGEGVGAVLLKPLNRAIENGDTIYAIIKGSSINAGGKTSGYSVPNPNAQAELISTALKNAQIDPRTISYVEAHGTGTSLGDPIEISGLMKAYQAHTRETQYCSIGSVKSNIGHSESAAGIAGLTKVLLQMKYKQLVPSLHAERLNPNINFTESPFYVQRTLADWQQPIIQKNGEEKRYSRRAAISSFGAGGANAHLILEEYEPPVPVREADWGLQRSQLIVLSAKNEDRLHAYINKILAFLKLTPTLMSEGGATIVDEAADLRQQIQLDLLKVTSDILKVSDNEIDLKEAFSDYGFDTVGLTQLSHRLNDKYHVSITPALLSEQGSLETVAQYLCDNAQYQARLTESTSTDEPLAHLSLANFVYTLQVGREAMAERLAMVVSSLEEIKNKLTQYTQGQTEIEDFYCGNVKTRSAQSELLIEGKAGEAFLKILIEEKQLPKLAQLWVSGVEIDWKLLYSKPTPQRISLPSYPFARERYWIPAGESKPKVLGEEGHVAKLHPLLGSNTSTLFAQKFTTQLTGEEFYLADHVVGEQKTLPGFAYLEMARAAGELAGEQPVIKLTNIVWARPITVSDRPMPVHISLSPVGQLVEFEVSTLDDNEHRQVHAQGKLTSLSQAILKDLETVDISAIQNRCFETWDGAKCYKLFQATGLNYGPRFQTIQVLYRNDSEALSRLQLPSALTDNNFNDLVLHPSLMDGALQTVLGLMGHTSHTPYLPFSLGEVELRGPLSDQSYAYVTVANHSPATEIKVTKFNISIVDGSGQVRVRLSDFSVRALTQPADTPVKKRLGIEGPQPIPAAKVASQDHHVLMAIKSQIESDIKDIASELLNINPQKLEVNENLGYFGFESISLKEFADKLSDTYQIDMSPSVFFAHSSIQSLSAYLLEEFEERMTSFYTNTEIPLVDKPDFGGESLPPLKPRALFRDRRPEISTDRGFDTIAIIGAHGVFPGSKDLSTFWHHLQAEHDLITEVPQDRWDWRECYGGTDIKNNKSNSKWGGFIPDVDKFDALFFKIPSREAEMMDPQHRLFIETVWKTIEDAGYRASKLSKKAVGVFVGVEFHDYELLLKIRADANPHAVTGNSPALLANRVSFLLNLRGPSESIVTACSASLTALHHAVNSIRSGESELAIAGGVSLMLSPEIMIGTSQLGVLSPDGRCKTFDKSANGYVKGEGVGAVLLKPLSQAIADNDNIYAVIKGTAINHGGKATSLTAPNSDAQAALLTKAYLEAGITPDTVTYLEVHGTGTELGDPVEIEGIKMAFRELASKQAKTIRQSHYCGLGSVKTNIGHLEPASGIAGLLKVILAMRHQYLPGILHLRTLNPYIELKDTPFYVVDKGRAWERLKDEEGHPIPRRAGISSFGFGGANAHLVLEEYENPQRSDILSQTPQLIVLSAKNDARLQAYAKEIIEFLSPLPSINATVHQGKVVDEAELRQQIQQYLKKAAGEILKVNNLDIDPDEALSEYGFDTVSLTGLCQRINDKYQISITSALLSEQKSLAAVAQYLCDKSQAGVKEGTTFNRETNLSLADLAYTLQVGREAMAERLAMVVSSHDEVRDKLTQYAQGQTEIEDFYRGNVKTNRAQSDLLIEGEAGDAFLRVVIEKKELTKLAQLWLSGVEIDWQLLYTNHTKPQRISLPTYPFAKDRYWLADVHSTNDVSQELEPVCLNKTQIEDVVKDEFKNLLTTEVGELDNIDLDKPFDNYGIDSIGLLGFRQKLQEKTGIELEWKWLLGESSPKMLVDNLSENLNKTYSGIEEETLPTLLDTEWMEGNPKRWYQLPHKNVHPIVFNITSLRHGSSLTSFILNANPHLYAPQGLYLLPFVNLKEREEALKQQTLFLEHGLPATIQDLWQVNEIAAQEMIQEWSIQNVPIQEIYHLLQEKCAPRILVDRGTIYGQSINVLQRAEKMFQNVKYLHLIRHPYSVLSSGVLMIQKTLVLKNLLSSDDEEAARTLHDYVDGAWYTTHVNALNFFGEIETNRWYRITYEDLLTDTRNKLEEICELIGVPFDESMLRPYDVPENVQLHNMSDDSGIATRDPKLMQRNQIDSKNANTWAKNIPQRQISPTTEYIATQFGYSLPHKDRADKTTDVLVKLNAMDSGLPVFMFPGSGGNILAFFKIASALKRPVWALRALDYAPMDSFQNLAAFYVNYLMDQIEDECCLVGYSSGVCACWEVANQLMDKNIHVKNLIMLDRNPFDVKSEIFGPIQSEEGSVRYEEYPETYALLVLGITKGLSKDRLRDLLSALWKVLRSEKVLQSGNEKSLFSVFQDFLLPNKIEMEEISQFVLNFIQQRRMLKNYQPSSMVPEVKNKIGILAAKSPKTAYPPGTTEIVVENCDHFSILTSDHLIVALSNVLT